MPPRLSGIIQTSQSSAVYLVLSYPYRRNPNKGCGLYWPLFPPPPHSPLLLLSPDQTWCFTTWPWVAWCDPLPLGVVSNKTSFKGIDLSVLSLSHLYKLRPGCKSSAQNIFLPSPSSFFEPNISFPLFGP